MNKSFRLLANLIMLILLIAVSCKKEPGQIGMNLQPESDKINVVFSDTTTLIAYSKIVDSIRSDEATLNLLGSYFDPVFGPNTAAFQVQARLSKTSYDFGTAPVLDSLILTLRIYDVYGDSLFEQHIVVYELDEAIYIDSSYYSTSTTVVKPTLLADVSFVPNINDSVVIDGDTLIPHQRIHLDEITTELGDRLLTADGDVMSNSTDFLEFFRGLRVKSEITSIDGGIMYVDLVNTMSRMILYYHNEDTDSLKYDYLFTDHSARYNNFYHDYSQGDAFFKAQVGGDSTLGNQVCYVQAMGGVKTKILFPYQELWYADGPIAVNEARLIIHGFEDDPFYDPPASLTLLKIDEDGNFIPLSDQFEGLDYFGGIYDEDKNQYFFRITTYMQSLIQGNENELGLELYVNGGAYVASRFLLNGPVPFDLEKKLKLELTYTRLN